MKSAKTLRTGTLVLFSYFGIDDAIRCLIRVFGLDVLLIGVCVNSGLIRHRLWGTFWIVV